MSASPEFYRPPAPPAFSPLTPPLLAPDNDDDGHDSSSCCRTPTAGITYLRREPTTCPPAPRKPKPPSCKKRLFQQLQFQQLDQAPGPVVISLRLHDLHRLFRPVDQVVDPQPKPQPQPQLLQCDDKRRRLPSDPPHVLTPTTTTTAQRLC